MEFDASFPTHGEAFELMEQGEGLLDDAAELAQALDVRSALAGDHRHDPAAPQITPHGLRVVRLVTQDGLGPTPWPAGPPGDGRDAVYQVEGLGDVVDVGGSRDDVQRGALAVSDQMVLAARLPPVDRRRTGRGTPFFARTWEPSTHARLQSSSPTACISASSRQCSCSKTRPSASDPGAASTFVQSRTPAPGAGVARRCPGAGRRGCPAVRACPALPGRDGARRRRPSQLRPGGTALKTPGAASTPG